MGVDDWHDALLELLESAFAFISSLGVKRLRRGGCVRNFGLCLDGRQGGLRARVKYSL